jgi:hypothetical protein
LTRFGDIEGDDVKKMILENIKTFIKKYLEIKQQQGNSIKKLQIDRKGKMIPLEYCEQILKSAKAIYPTASKRRSSSETSDKTLADYETFYDETLSPEVKNAYTIAKGIQRGGNGAYTDCKCIFQSENEH